MKIAAWLLLLAPACGSSSAGRAPEASVAETQQAQREFREIHRRWTTARPADRGKLDPRLRAFLKRHPDDRRARVVRVYLAWIEVQRGRLDEARAWVAGVREGPAGSARDFANIAHAAILIREGKPDQALSILLPLEGKVVDPEERFIYGEERVVAALAAHHEREAIFFMRDWLAQAASEDRDAVQGRVRELLGALGAPPLESVIAELRGKNDSGAKNPDVATAGKFVHDMVGDRLIEIALRQQDQKLARRLLDSGDEHFHRGDKGADLARIASAGSIAPRVQGRTVGLVLSVGDAAARTRSAEVASGLSRALGLPASASKPEAVQLLTAEDSGDETGIALALAELAGEGAAVLVAGVDSTGASRAAKYAEEASIPVILLTHQAPKKGGFAFTIGSDPSADSALLEAAATENGASRIARVGPDGVPCNIEPTAAGMPRFPIQDWKKESIQALIVVGDQRCTRDVTRESLNAKFRPLVLLSLESADLVDEIDPTLPRVAASAGSFPWRKSAATSGSLSKFALQSGRGPTWYATLGHDAAVLAMKALEKFPLERADDARVVTELHRLAQKRLAEAKAELWSSDRSGFEGGRALARTLKPIGGKK